VQDADKSMVWGAQGLMLEVSSSAAVFVQHPGTRAVVDGHRGTGAPRYRRRHRVAANSWRVIS